MQTSNTSHDIPAPQSALRHTMRRHPLLFFFAMSYVFSWAVSVPYVLSSWGVLSGTYTTLFILKPFAGPTLAAIVMTSILEGREGLSQLRQRLRWRGGSLVWSLVILVAVPVMILVGLLVQPGILSSFQGLDARAMVIYPVYFIVVLFGVALPEEIGWRGFALPRMQRRYGPLWGTVVLGVLWAFWHALYFLTPDHGGGPGVRLATTITNFALFLPLVICLAIVFTWVFNHTHGSIFMANLLHAAIDTPQLVWIPFFVAVDETKLDLANLLVFGAAALLIVVLTHGRLGYQGPESRPQTTETKTRPNSP